MKYDRKTKPSFVWSSPYNLYQMVSKNGGMGDVTISCLLAKEKALDLVKEFSYEKVEASEGWLYKWMKK